MTTKTFAKGDRVVVTRGSRKGREGVVDVVMDPWRRQALVRLGERESSFYSYGSLRKVCDRPDGEKA